MQICSGLWKFTCVLKIYYYFLGNSSRKCGKTRNFAHFWNFSNSFLWLFQRVFNEKFWTPHRHLRTSRMPGQPCPPAQTPPGPNQPMEGRRWLWGQLGDTLRAASSNALRTALVSHLSTLIGSPVPLSSLLLVDMIVIGTRYTKNTCYENMLFVDNLELGFFSLCPKYM